MLGVSEGSRLDQVRGIGLRRAVTVAIVGQGGVSKARLAALLTEGNSLEYRGGAKDPESNTHDTGMARVTLELTSRLGIGVRLLAYQPGASFQEVAQAMAQAGAEADIVAFYQSFWGENITYIADSIRDAESCLFISPYVEYQSRPTSTCVQAHSDKPWAEGFPNFITVVPLSRKAPGRILSPSSREGDTEIINFVAPSYYASGAGGTCPSAAVAASVAAYIVAASEEEPSPAQIVELMRDTVAVDAATLTSVPEYGDDSVAEVAAHIRALVSPEAGADRKLDALGVLNLWQTYQRITASPNSDQ